MSTTHMSTYLHMYTYTHAYACMVGIHTYIEYMVYIVEDDCTHNTWSISHPYCTFTYCAYTTTDYIHKGTHTSIHTITHLVRSHYIAHMYMCISLGRSIQYTYIHVLTHITNTRHARTHAHIHTHTCTQTDLPW